jgi:hypothetical protein
MTVRFARRSRLAAWSARLASLAVPVLLIVAGATRIGWIETVPAYAALALGFTLAALAMLTGIAAFAVIWREGSLGAGQATVGFVVGLALLALPAAGAWRVMTHPNLADVSTSPENPPVFAAAMAARAAEGAPAIAADAATVALQRRAYPDIVPRHLAFPPARVFEVSRALSVTAGWRLLDARPPTDTTPGRIEAVAATPLFGLRQDVVVLVRPDGEGTLVEMRSASRAAAHDLGANAERIRAFLTALDEALAPQGDN